MNNNLCKISHACSQNVENVEYTENAEIYTENPEFYTDNVEFYSE